MNDGQHFGIGFHDSYLTFDLSSSFQVYAEYRFVGIVIGVVALVALAKRIIKNKRGL